MSAAPLAMSLFAVPVDPEWLSDADAPDIREYPDDAAGLAAAARKTQRCGLIVRARRGATLANLADGDYCPVRVDAAGREAQTGFESGTWD